MKDDAIWQAFASTGDPVYYLLYKTVESKKSKKQKEDLPGQVPRPTD